jgi:predicted dehydrogenase
LNPFFSGKFYFCWQYPINLKKQSMNRKIIPAVAVAALLVACAGGGQKASEKEKTMSKFTGAKGEVKLMTLDPGHFHAALIQKSMYEQIDSTVYVYAPEGDDITQHLGRINGFNSRAENPTAWIEKVFTGPDYFEKMLAEKPGNVMMVAGNNAKKTEYIQKAIEAGINVFADKPMVISPEAFPVLEQAFKTAEEKGVLLYDIMTERHEITSIIQRELARNSAVFGTLLDGTPEEPAIVKESVHHFSKMVSGAALKRPAWFFDVAQQGEGIVDVTTHLVDLVQWGGFPEVILNKTDVELISAKRWATDLSLAQFEKVTQLKEFPEYLQKDVLGNQLKVYSNGEIVYKLKGKVVKVSVIWNFEAPEGAGDTHFSIMRGTNCNVLIKQDKEQGYKPTVYIEATNTTDLVAFETSLKKAVEQDIAANYPELKLNKLGDKLWTVEIPDRYKVGHEAHFGQVTEKYLQYLKDGKLPEWEVPNMITKYYTTTEALKLARK